MKDIQDWTKQDIANDLASFREYLDHTEAEHRFRKSILKEVLDEKKGEWWQEDGEEVR